MPVERKHTHSKANANFDYWLNDAITQDDYEEMIFFYHKDLPKAFGIGSSTQISDGGANIIQHIEYLPYGETFFERRDYWNTPYKFNAKELDEETGMYYYGARYYTPEVSIWLSVDPLADKYPSMTPYMYCAGNPVALADMDGREPIKPYAGTIEGFMKFFLSLETGIASTKGTEAHDAMIRMGEVKIETGGIKPANTGPFNKSEGNRYIYTKKGGWIDMSHFMFYAGRAYKAKLDKENAENMLNETYFHFLNPENQFGIIKVAYSSPVYEAVQLGYIQEFMDKYCATYSAYSYEDLPSNYFGADFAVNYFNPNSNLSFGDQLQNYFTNILQATNPEMAPNYKELPSEYPKDGELPSKQNRSSVPMFTSE